MKKKICNSQENSNMINVSFKLSVRNIQCLATPASVWLGGRLNHCSLKVVQMKGWVFPSNICRLFEALWLCEDSNGITDLQTK